MKNNKILGDITGIVRNNREKLFGMNRKNTLRLNNIISRLSLLNIEDIRFNEILDNLTKGTLINLDNYNDFLNKVDLLDEDTINSIGENKQSIMQFFDSIKLDISEFIPKQYVNDKVTGIMEAGF